MQKIELHCECGRSYVGITIRDDLEAGLIQLAKSAHGYGWLKIGGRFFCSESCATAACGAIRN